MTHDDPNDARLLYRCPACGGTGHERPGWEQDDPPRQVLYSYSADARPCKVVAIEQSLLGACRVEQRLREAEQRNPAVAWLLDDDKET